MGTTELQKEIKSVIATIGWNQNKLALVLYTELHDTDVEEEINRFKERVKKDLSRSSTKEEKLKNYLDIISQHPDFIKNNLVNNNFKSCGQISSFIEKEMQNLSKKIDGLLHSTYNKG